MVDSFNETLKQIITKILTTQVGTGITPLHPLLLSLRCNRGYFPNTPHTQCVCTRWSWGNTCFLFQMTTTFQWWGWWHRTQASRQHRQCSFSSHIVECRALCVCWVETFKTTGYVIRIQETTTLSSMFSMDHRKR